jgi:MFS superfamily sulfate permease-like transporter
MGNPIKPGNYFCTKCGSIFWGKCVLQIIAGIICILFGIFIMGNNRTPYYDPISSSATRGGLEAIGMFLIIWPIIGISKAKGIKN